MHRDDGGSAFPVAGYDVELAAREPGMSLRDWFAGHALSAFGAWSPAPPEAADKIRASRAYEIADAMLAERAKPMTIRTINPAEPGGTDPAEGSAMPYTITSSQVQDAEMAADRAADLIMHLAQLSDAHWLSAGQAELRAEWAFSAFDRLCERMASIPRPAKPGGTDPAEG